MRNHYRWLAVAAVVVLAGYAALSIARAVSNVLAFSGAVDFHPYWLAGLYLQQGTDPYEASLAGLPLLGAAGSAVPGLSTTPANSPFIVLLLAPLSLLAWPEAKVMWLLVNLTAVLVTPWLIVQQRWLGLTAPWKLALCLGFYSMLGTRVLLGNGQVTGLVLMLMVSAVALAHAQRSPWVTGVALGASLSKVSVGFPLFVYFALKRQWTVLIAAAAVQALGLLTVSLLTDRSPVAIAMDYVQIVVSHADDNGVNLTGHWALPWQATLAAALVFSGAIFGALFRWRKGASLPNADDRNVDDRIDHALLAVLMVWALLVAYHAVYDSVIAFVALVVVASAALNPELWSLRGRAGRMLLPYLALSFGVLALPGEFLATGTGLWHWPWWDAVARAAVTVDLLALLGVSMFLLGRGRAPK